MNSFKLNLSQALIRDYQNIWPNPVLDSITVDSLIV
jgi:hypothetical protein